MKDSPAVSVIIPLYNQVQFVAQALDSVLDQGYAPLEVIVVDDGSSDDPMSVLKDYEPKITLIRQENRGLAAARNAGVNASSGDYLQFLDADDMLHPGKISMQLDSLRSSGKQVSYCEILTYLEGEGTSDLRYICPREDLFSCLYNFWNPYPLPVHGVLMSRELFERFGPFVTDLRACEDRYFFSLLTGAGVEFHYFPFIGGKRRVHGSNMNKDRSHIILNIVKYYRRVNERFGDDFFMETYGFTGFQMMCANLTHIYRMEILAGQPRKRLAWIKGLMKEEGIPFAVEAIPPRHRHGLKSPRSLMLRAHLSRLRGRLPF